MAEKQESSAKIICVDEGRELARQAMQIFHDKDYSFHYERSLHEVGDRFEREEFDLMLFSSSVAYSQPEEALELLELICAKCPGTLILFFTKPRKLKIAHQALRVGVYHYSILPVSDEELRLLIETALDTKPQLGLNLMLRTEVGKNNFESMVGRSTAMLQVYKQIRQAAATEIPVLLSGETGTGKELVALAIHELSDRSENPYVPVHIGALPTDLVASEIFGHERGAFSGATRQRKGCFEVADSGTVFMDEIATIDDKMQVSLLRLLETSEYTRIGSQERIPVDVRVIAATNANLLSEINKGNFREDLYYRLDVLHIIMPPLRERHGDIHILMDHFIKYSCDTFQKTIRGVSPAFVSCLESYPWPGNIRELKNVIQRAVISCSGDILEMEHLPRRIAMHRHKDVTVTIRIGMSIAEVEKEMIIRTLDHANNNRTMASELLGISRRSLYNKMEKYSISTEKVQK